LKYFRASEDVQNDLIMPFLGLGGAEPGTEVRVTAVMEVLRRLPGKDYRTLKGKAVDDDEFQWFIPMYECLGEVYPFFANIFSEERIGELELKPYAKVIFLSARLEEIDFDISVAVVAHELAHIVLGHKVRTDNETYEAQERFAWNKVIEWGFTKEEKKHRSFSLESMKSGKKE
jgi:hypothetical protein